MAMRKINLKTSVSSLNVKQIARKQKQRKIKKLKSILANACKTQLDKLSGLEAQDLTTMMREEILNSNFPGRCYARTNGWALGLENSLRAINHRQASCVLISLSIRPSFIVNQIGYFSKARNRKVPVLTVTNLENLTDKLFGIRSLVVVMPVALPPRVADWVKDRVRWTNERLQIAQMNKANSTKNIEPKVELHDLYMTKPKKTIVRAFNPVNLGGQYKPVGSAEVNEWLGDYMAFTKKVNNPDLKKEDFQKDKDRMFAALRRMASNIEGEETLFQRETKKLEKARARARAKALDGLDWNNLNPYGKSYKPLEVHKIQPNPEAKSRKTRTEQKPDQPSVAN